MRALTVRQPWAWAIIHGRKDLENRSWRPPDELLGQRIAIHASSRRVVGEDRDSWPAINARSLELGGAALGDPEDWIRGAIIGTVRLVGVRTEANGNRWFLGPLAWELEDPRPLEPSRVLPVRGRLGLWDVATVLTTELERL